MSIIQEPKSAFARLRDLAHNIVPKAARIIIIPKDQFKVRCTNEDFHGKMKEMIVFRPGIWNGQRKIWERKPVTELQCSCGIIYKQEE